jgi:hypothetical protein
MPRTSRPWTAPTAPQVDALAARPDVALMIDTASTPAARTVYREMAWISISPGVRSYDFSAGWVPARADNRKHLA